MPMYTHAGKSYDDNKTASAANLSNQQSSSNSAFALTDNRTHFIKQVAQLVRKEHKGINGLTHLVEMTGDGHLYTGENWLSNERQEVTGGDLLEVDLDDRVYSHRGINQETNWQRDEANDQPHLWVRVLKLNHLEQRQRLYVRMEMLNDGHEAIPKVMHSIWVQGGGMPDKPSAEGMQSRQGRDLEGWVSMEWLYETGRQPGGFSPDLQRQPLDLNTGGFVQVFKKSFVDEMNAWHNRPSWVSSWMKILEVLYAKKSFITMSDIMRMIILYYHGGIYMDVKIKVHPGHADFKTKPMLLINTVNFYDRENWAIMANAGCRMIEDIMRQALVKFPSLETLGKMKENYSSKEGVEDKAHVDLHEVHGVWSVIDKDYRDFSYDVGLKLENLRPKNSWADANDDRAADVISKENEESRQYQIKLLEQKLVTTETLKRQFSEHLMASRIPAFARTLNLTPEVIKELPAKIEKLDQEIKDIKQRLLKLKEGK